MPERRKISMAVIIALFLVAVYSSLTTATAQTTYTNTVTQMTSVYSTNVQVTTLINSTTAYTTTTETSNSTIHGTQTRIVSSLTTATSTLTSAVDATVIATSSITLTTVSTQMTQILGNIWGESLAVVLLAGALTSYLIPKARSRRPKGIVCGNCGNLNPPFTGRYCVKCGRPLKEKS